jgi:Asp-tRNA(Asn)/Glu-tRNA(Gln) amidotransferase A subunit family amidase
LASTAPRLGEIAGSDVADYDAFIKRTGEFSPFTSLFNITGQPAISLPLAISEGGLPIGVQFVARFGNEALLLQLATYFEQAMPWRDRRPAMHASREDSINPMTAHKEAGK